jgi:GT2 family glycosyltransferase
VDRVASYQLPVAGFRLQGDQPPASSFQPDGINPVPTGAVSPDSSPITNHQSLITSSSSLVTHHSSLSIVIVNYNTREDVRLCLNALRGSAYPAEVIVVDNASSDGSAAMIRAEFPEVKLLTPNHNLWYCGGNNLGIRASSGEYVLLLNPDTIPQPDALAIMMDFLTTHPDYAGVTIQLRYPDGSLQLTCSARRRYAHLLLEHSALGWLLPGLRRRLHAEHIYADWDRTTERDVEAVPGSCTLMRRADVLLDDRLLLYFPEDDLAERFAGRKWRFLTGSHIIHREKSVTRTWLASRIYFRDMLAFSAKYFGRPRTALLWLLTRPLLWAMALKRRLSASIE